VAVDSVGARHVRLANRLPTPPPSTPSTLVRPVGTTWTNDDRSPASALPIARVGTSRRIVLASRHVGHTAGVGELLRVTRSCAVPLDELTWRFSTGGGPGGQHANTSNTRVEVRFDVAGSPSLGPRQRARLLERLGPVVRVTASDERSQARNRQLALDRLRSRLAEGLRVERERRPTAPTTASRERRVEAKRRRSDVKRLRGRPSPED
jgi:ribosome-associated protein